MCGGRDGVYSETLQGDREQLGVACGLLGSRQRLLTQVVRIKRTTANSGIRRNSSAGVLGDPVPSSTPFFLRRKAFIFPK